MNTQHCMLDLETLSTKPNAYVLAIGAVMFDQSGIQDKFYQAIRTPAIEQLKLMTSALDISDATLEWWSQQSDEARAVFTDPNAVSLEMALARFTLFCTKHDRRDNLCMWGNGSDFDNVILANAYDFVEQKRPWLFYNNRCYRTVKSLFPSIKMRRIGTYHNAVDDAQSQAEHLLRMNCIPV